MPLSGELDGLAPAELENVMTVELDWEFSWVELAEMAWWEANPSATDAEFESSFYGE